MSKQTIKVPDLGGATEVEVIEVCVAVGDTVTQEQSLIVVESDKASMDIPCPLDGVVVSIALAEGATVSEGDIILELETAGDNAAANQIAADEVANEAEVQPTAEPAAASTASQASEISDSVTEIRVPDLGGAEKVELIELSVAVGDTIDEGDALAVMESDKASMDLPSPYGGVITELHVKEGDSVSEGDLIAGIKQAANAVSAASVEASTNNQVEPVTKAAEVAPASTLGSPATSIQSVSVPDLGGADKVELIEVLVSVGDRINEGDGIVVMESDKASMELPSPITGVITVMHVKEGDSLSEGDAVAEVEVISSGSVEQTAQAVEPATVSVGSPTVAKAKEAANPPSSNAALAADRRRKTDVYAGPAVRKLARELGVDLSRVTGTGPRDRLSKEDLHAFVKKAVNEPQGLGGAIPKVPEIDFSQFGDIEIKPMTKLHKMTAANMHRSWLNVPHVTQFDEADITELELFRTTLKPEMERRGIKITPLPFLMKAIAAALRANPAFNASLGADGESIVYKNYVHIGMAVDTPAGLMVPVIRDVDTKGIWDLSVEILELATKAKERKLKPNEMQGGCFTISSLGGIGGTGFTPIVNTPEVGILGVSKLQIKPVYVNGNLEPRKMLPLSLSYDHRAVNGGDAGRFVTFLSAVLADVRRLVL